MRQPKIEICTSKTSRIKSLSFSPRLFDTKNQVPERIWLTLLHVACGVAQNFVSPISDPGDSFETNLAQNQQREDVVSKSDFKGQSHGFRVGNRLETTQNTSEGSGDWFCMS